jgi:hypothetical protein
VRGWPELQIALNELEIRLRRFGRPDAAIILVNASRRLREELLTLEREMAVFATEELRKMERATRVRPDTQGGGGPRLGDSLVAEPLGEPLLPGSVLVADTDLLDQNVPWWVTNEEGSSARVGGTIYGVFYDSGGFGPPDPSEFRVHPLFEAEPVGAPGAGRGVISNPIPERRFVKRAILEVIAPEWQRRFRTIKAAFDLEMERAVRTPT